MEIIDTAGDASLSAATIQKGDAFLCVFSVDSIDSFKMARNHIKTIRREKNVPLGNKCEIGLINEKSKTVTSEMANVPYYEVSALGCLEELFYCSFRH